MTWTQLINEPFALLDGAMGTVLQQKGLQAGGEPVLLSLTQPDLVRSVHESYVEAGAQIVYTNTFTANRYKLKDASKVAEVIPAAIRLAKEAAKGRALVALDIGPIGQLMEPTGPMSFEEAYDIFAQMLSYSQGADVVVFETFTELYELKAALLAAKETTDLPVLCSMTFEADGRTFTGTSPMEMCLTLEGLGASALGINCSLGPKELLPLVSRLCRISSLPVFVKPNAGLPDPVSGEYRSSPEEFARELSVLARCGVRLFGGCCGTTPEHLAALKRELEQKPSDLPRLAEGKRENPAVCSGSLTVEIEGPCIIGERINPTGKKKMKQALLDGDMDYILGQAVEQANAGAQILDVNVGLPGVDEKEMMVRAVKAIQSVSDLPLQLDSSSAEALEAGLRVCNGKAIVNSVNGKKDSLESVLPLVKRYGACVVGLTLDENGIPPKAEGRFAIAEKIAGACDKMGIPRKDLFIDCLTLTAATDQENALETLKALRLCKERLGVKTVLGVSNISFGLPARELLNQSFLTMALYAGLDLPILNPNNAAMAGAVRAYRALAAWDTDSKDFVNCYSQREEDSRAVGMEEHSLSYCLENGLQKEAQEAARRALARTEPLELVNQAIVPALDRAGERFESGAIFLPQLIRCASAAQAAFEVISEAMAGQEQQRAQTVVLATVKNDIHDIGKNIVRTLLKNYGFSVVDLGKEVAPEAVARAVEREKAPLLGLSALMTTTVESMRQTVALVKSRCPQCRIMVGGAVLTEEYAKEIGADFYAKDAKAAVDIAKAVFAGGNTDRL